MKTTMKLTYNALPKDYGGLCHVYLPRVIHDKSGFEAAEEIADAMACNGDAFTLDQQDYYELVTDLMCDYEESQPVGKPERLPLKDRLESLMESADWNASDLARFLGLDATMGNKIMRGERKLTLGHIEKLRKGFNLKAEYFLD